MSVLTQSQVEQIAASAGFSGRSRQIIVAIAEAESGFDTKARNSIGNSAGVDRGILQINNYYHAEVTDACAYDPKCAFSAGYRISAGGSNFTPWTTYNNGAYLRYMDRGGQTPGSNRGVQAARSYMVPNGTLISIWGDPRANGPHQGEDLQATEGSPIYAPEAGQIVYAQYGGNVDPLGGNVTYLKGKSGLVWYFAHMQYPGSFANGSSIRAGQILGNVGTTGDARGTPPHLHYQVGRNAAWGNPVSVLANYVAPGQRDTGRGGGGTGGMSADLIRQTILPGGTLVARFGESGLSRVLPGDLLAAPGGSIVYSPEAGQVVDNNVHHSDLYYVVIQGASGIRYRMSHLGYRSRLIVGASVRAGAEVSNVKGRGNVDYAEPSILVSYSKGRSAPQSLESLLGSGRGTPRVYRNVSDQIHEILAHTPGFYGIALAVDAAEQFPGFVTPPESNGGILDLGLGDALRSVWLTASANLMPAFVRGLTVFVGLFLVMALIWNAIGKEALSAGMKVL